MTLTVTDNDGATATTSQTVTVTGGSGGGGDEDQTDTVWVEDSTPVGASLSGTWNWVSSGPAPYSGAKAHQSILAARVHQHYFLGASERMSVSAGDTLFTYVYIDPASPPREIMLQWNDGDWNQRAYWGENLINWGTDGTVSRRYMGALPAAGQWVRLEIPASAVGLEGRSVNGMAFTLYDGRATWDRAGVSGASVQPNSPPAAAFNASCDALSCSFADNSSDTDGSVVGWSWDFGDGTSATSANPSHGYASSWQLHGETNRHRQRGGNGRHVTDRLP